MLCGIFYSAIAEEERSRTQFALFSYMQSIQMKWRHSHLGPHEKVEKSAELSFSYANSKNPE